MVYLMHKHGTVQVIHRVRIAAEDLDHLSLGPGSDVFERTRHEELVARDARLSYPPSCFPVCEGDDGLKQLERECPLERLDLSRCLRAHARSLTPPRDNREVGLFEV